MKTGIKLEIDSMELLERRINLLEKKIADLEVQVQSKQENEIDVKELSAKIRNAFKEQSMEEMQNIIEKQDAYIRGCKVSSHS